MNSIICYLKKGILIWLFVFSVILISLSIYILLTYNRGDLNAQKQIPVQNYVTLDSALIGKYQEVILPDYVPPKNGGSNKLWKGNRHRYLLKDRECYFGKGMKHRYRWGQQRQNEETK